MNALTFLEKYGWSRAEAVAEAAGTNRAYFSQIAYRRRRPSYELAKRLVEESGYELDLESLMAKPTNQKQSA